MEPKRSQVKMLHKQQDIGILPRTRLKTPQTSLIPTVCFYNGSFVPIHAGHINVLQEAKHYIDQLGSHELMGAYISPSHSAYVGKKLRSEEYLSVGDRLAMIHLAIKDLDWVMVDLYETFQPQSTSLSVILKAFIERVRSQLPGAGLIEVFWLMGEDSMLYPSWDTPLSLGFHSLYIINRANSTQEENTLEKRWQTFRSLSSFPERIHLVQAKNLNLSSTAIRSAARTTSDQRLEQIQENTRIDKVTHYIMKKSLWNINNHMLPICMLPPEIFPNEGEDLSSDFLSTMLSVFTKEDIKVSSFESKRIGIGKGRGGSVYRLQNIDYSTKFTAILPQSFVFKTSTGIWNGDVVTSEPEFYDQLRDRISHIEIPQCYYTARSVAESRRAVLLLEDLSQTCKEIRYNNLIEERYLFPIIAAIASLHAEFFEHPILKSESFVWLTSPVSKIEHYQTKYSSRMTRNDLLAILKPRVSEKAYKYASAFAEKIPNIFHRLTEENCTLVHGDFWLNNMMLRNNEPHRLVLLDWQTCCRANGLLDIAFLMCHLGRESARQLEPRVLALYHETLVKYGVTKYAEKKLYGDYYTLALPYMFLMSCLWNHRWRLYFDDIISLLEDIAFHEDNNDNGDQTLPCSCD